MAVIARTRRRIEIYRDAGETWRFAESLKSVSEDTAQEYEGRTILELVQNGHDALGDADPGRIAVLAVPRESGGVLYVANEGTAFAEENFRAITELALSSKAAGEGIGNKGLGFRSVLQLTDWPEIYSKSSPDSPVFDGYCFRFARPEDVRTLVDDPALAAPDLEDPGAVHHPSRQGGPRDLGTGRRACRPLRDAARRQDRAAAGVQGRDRWQGPRPPRRQLRHVLPGPPLQAHRRRRGAGPQACPPEDAPRHGGAGRGRHVHRRRYPPAHLRPAGHPGNRRRQHPRSCGPPHPQLPHHPRDPAPGHGSGEPKSVQITFDDLDDGTDTLDGYRSVLRGPAPELVRCESWDDELAQLAATPRAWRQELATGGADGKARDPRDPRGTIAVCVADRDAVNQVMYHLATEAELIVVELTKEGVKGDGDIHVGTMHRFKGLEYQRLAIVGVRDDVIPRASVVQCYRDMDHRRLAREEMKARSLLFVAATRARDTLRISWYGKPSPYLPR